MASAKRRKPKARSSREAPRRPRTAAPRSTVGEAFESTMSEIVEEIGSIAESVARALGFDDVSAPKRRPITRSGKRVTT